MVVGGVASYFKRSVASVAFLSHYPSVLVVGAVCICPHHYRDYSTMTDTYARFSRPPTPLSKCLLCVFVVCRFWGMLFLVSIDQKRRTSILRGVGVTSQGIV